jgi:glycosyltransferase involved in cell wall biosynthesis
MKIGYFTSGFYPANKESIKAIEYWTYQLATAMAKKGHDVHFFCNRNSKSNLHHNIHPKYSSDFLDKIKNDDINPYLVDNFCDFVDYANKNNLDIIHDQTTVMPTALSRYAKMPVVCTVHGVLDDPIRNTYYEKNQGKNNYYVAVSNFVKKNTKGIKFREMIHHGIDTDRFEFSEKGYYFLSIGRIVPNKGQLDAIAAAKRTGDEFILAGYQSNYDSSDDYYNEALEKVSNSKSMKFIGKVKRADLPRVMGQAKALLMPIKWPEAFGLVMTEALSCGTPVIAYDRGPVREIIKDGVNGFVVKADDIEAMARAMKKIDQIDRKKCRESAIAYFSHEKMVAEYEKLYTSLAKK